MELNKGFVKSLFHVNLERDENFLVHCSALETASDLIWCFDFFMHFATSKITQIKFYLLFCA